MHDTDEPATAGSDDQPTRGQRPLWDRRARLRDFLIAGFAQAIPTYLLVAPYVDYAANAAYHGRWTLTMADNWPDSPMILDAINLGISVALLISPIALFASVITAYLFFPPPGHRAARPVLMATIGLAPMITWIVVIASVTIDPLGVIEWFLD